MNKSKTTEQLARECDLETIGDYGNTWFIPIENLEAFRKACEADFISRCTFDSHTTVNLLTKELYILPNNGE